MTGHMYVCMRYDITGMSRSPWENSAAHSVCLLVRLACRWLAFIRRRRRHTDSDILRSDTLPATDDRSRTGETVTPPTKLIQRDNRHLQRISKRAKRQELQRTCRNRSWKKVLSTFWTHKKTFLVVKTGYGENCKNQIEIDCRQAKPSN